MAREWEGLQEVLSRELDGMNTTESLVPQGIMS